MVLLGDVEFYMHLLFFLREKYIALYERIKLYLLNYRQQLVYYMYGSWTVRKEIFSYEYF